MKERIRRSIDLRTSKLFEITFFDSNQPTQLGRIRTKDKDLIYDFIKYVIVKPEVRDSATEMEQGLLFNLVPPCEECEDPILEDKEQCLLDGECHQDTSFGFEWLQIDDRKGEQEFRLITGEDMFWDLTLLTKEELKILKDDPNHWTLAAKKCKSGDWHEMVARFGTDRFFELLGQKHGGDLDSLIKEETKDDT